MAKIYDSIMSLIKPARIATAAAELGESESKITKGVDIILPALLGRLLKKGDAPEVVEVLKESQRLKIYENYDNIWKGSGIDTHKNMGERLENRLLGTHDPKFNSLVGAHTGLKKEHTDRLTNWVTATIAAWIASHVNSGKSYKSILADLAGEKAELRKDVPADVIAELGLAHTLGVPAVHKTVSKPAVAPKEKCALCWLWWLFGIIALALIIFFVVRSCKPKSPEIVTETQETIVHQVTPDFTEEKMILPDGTPITMYRGNIEKAIKAFLDSDKYKNGTEAELRSVWFEFPGIDFEHNSATDLMPGAQTTLNTLVNVLKGYPSAKIKIGAFADKTGTRAVNYTISEKRARNIEVALVKAGHSAASMSVEGFGEQYANVPADATNAQRAIDRDIAMRFTK